MQADKPWAARTSDAGNGKERSGLTTRRACENKKEESTSRENLGAIHPKIQSAKQSMEDPELIEIIRAEIGANGPISFARFMELALYHPEHGYYGSGRASIGRRGDFFTNVSVGPLFGKLVAAQFCEIWEKLGQP